MDTMNIIREYSFANNQGELVCPYCGNVLEEVDDKWYCENCGVREV